MCKCTAGNPKAYCGNNGCVGPDGHVCDFRAAINLDTLESWFECGCGRKMKEGFRYYRRPRTAFGGLVNVD